MRQKLFHPGHKGILCLCTIGLLGYGNETRLMKVLKGEVIVIGMDELDMTKTKGFKTENAPQWFVFSSISVDILVRLHNLLMTFMS